MLLLFAWMVALLLSAEFLLSVSMIGLMLLALFELKDGKFGFRRNLGENVKGLWKDKSWIAFTAPFLLVVLSAPYSGDDSAYLLERLRIKLPFLILPFAFVSVPRFTPSQYARLHYGFLILLCLTAIGVLVNYALDFEAINASIRKGQPIPTPTNHIRYSLMVAFGIPVSFFLFKRKTVFTFPWERWLVIAMGVFLLIFIHVLSVRSGLAVFYLTVMCLILRWMIRSKKILLGILLGLGIIAMPLSAYFTVPSFKNKMDYMLWDLKMYAQGTGETYSDSERLNSLLVARDIIKEEPVLGVGAGDLKYQVNKSYVKLFPDLPEESRKMPHNQFISVLAGTGMVGLKIFMFSLFFLFVKFKRFRNVLFLSFFLIMLFSFLVENTIENAIGIGLFSLFILIGMNFINEELKIKND